MPTALTMTTVMNNNEIKNLYHMFYQTNSPMLKYIYGHNQVKMKWFSFCIISLNKLFVYPLLD